MTLKSTAVRGALALWAMALAPQARAARDGVPPYEHVIVIVEANKDYDQILDPAAAPNIARLAKE